MASDQSHEKMAVTKGSSSAHSRLVDEILSALGTRPDCRIWKNHTGTAVTSGRGGQPSRFIRFGLKGSADILGITADGKFLAIEAKTGKARQSKQQIAFMKMIIVMQGRYWLVRHVDEAREKIDELRLNPIDFKLV